MLFIENAVYRPCWAATLELHITFKEQSLNKTLDYKIKKYKLKIQEKQKIYVSKAATQKWFEK